MTKTPTVNPINFRVPPNLKGKVHADVEQTIMDHDNAIVDLQQANAALKQQIDALNAQVSGKK